MDLHSLAGVLPWGLGMVAALFASGLYARRDWVKERDAIRLSVIGTLKQQVEEERALCASEKARLGGRIAELELHHSHVHRRCADAP